MNALFTALEPAIVEIAGLFVAGLIAWAANTARQRFGLEIEEKHRDALHSAIMSGIRAALVRGLDGPDAVQDVVDHVSRSTPDALHKLKPAPGVLENIIVGKLREVKDSFSIYERYRGLDASTLTPAGAA